MPTPTATFTQLTTDCSARTAGPLNMIVLHHAATASLQAILTLFAPGGRQVSAHRAIKDGQNVETVPEAKRAWSLADAYWDSRAFTVECANESTTGWTISAASHETLAQQCASWARRYGFPIVRTGDPKGWTLLGHREVYSIHGGSYATACPGGMDLDWIAKRANQILAGEIVEGDDEMLFWKIANLDSSGLNGTYWMLRDGFLAVFPSQAVAEAEAKRWGKTIETLQQGSLLAHAEHYYGIPQSVWAPLATGTGPEKTWFRPTGVVSGGLTPAQDAKVMGSAQADALAKVQTGVAAIPTEPPNYIPQAP